MQRSTEDKGFNPAVHTLESIQKLNQEAAVEVHRFTDITKQYQLELLPFLSR